MKIQAATDKGEAADMRKQLAAAKKEFVEARAEARQAGVLVRDRIIIQPEEEPLVLKIKR